MSLQGKLVADASITLLRGRWGHMVIEEKGTINPSKSWAWAQKHKGKAVGLEDKGIGAIKHLVPLLENKL